MLSAKGSRRIHDIRVSDNGDRLFILYRMIRNRYNYLFSRNDHDNDYLIPIKTSDNFQISHKRYIASKRWQDKDEKERVDFVKNQEKNILKLKVKLGSENNKLHVCKSFLNL